MSSLHEPDDQLELYALDRLPEDAMERVEGHVLICDHCRTRLDDIGEFAYTMRQSLLAAQTDQVPAERGWFHGWHLKVAFGGAIAFALLYVVFVYRSSHLSGLAPVASLTLSAVRGESAVAAPGLEYDLTLRAASGSNLPVEVVDAAGKVVWSGTAAAYSDGVRARVTKPLQPGSYFVRLKSPSGELVHEYGLDIRP